MTATLPATPPNGLCPPAPPAGHPARVGAGVYWDAAGGPHPAGRPGVTLAAVTSAGVEVACDDPLTGFFSPNLLFVPVGQVRPVPGWPGWAVGCSGVYLAPEWWWTHAVVWLAYDGPPLPATRDRPYTPTPF